MARLINNKKYTKQELEETIQKALSVIDFQISKDKKTVAVSEEYFLSVLYFLIKNIKLPPMTFNFFEGQYNNFKLHYYYNPEIDEMDVKDLEEAVNSKIIDIDNFELVIDDQYHIFKNKIV